MKAKRARPKAEAGPRVVQRNVVVGLEALEIARGHDGLLRGAPEPVFVVALCERVNGQLATAERAIVRFPGPTAIPGTVKLPAATPLRHRRKVKDDDVLLVFVCALEEDAGTGVARIYELLAEPEVLLAYGSEEAAPDPRGLPAVLPARPWPSAPRVAVDVVHEGASLAELAAGDDLIGAFVVGLPAGETSVRLRFLDRARRNDWTLPLRIVSKP
jgi:hypothetical protein